VLLGYTADEYLADPFLVWKLVHPDDAAILQRLIRQSWETGVPYSHEYRMRTRTGGER
jgi:PAS domain-containing protein